jgi:DNA polymerase V|tara:strand:+ start:176 stop:631 length:456 start_codon:yes stop_codon:yes gene_type:complete
MNSIKKIKTTDNLEFYSINTESKNHIPFIDTMISAGFPSPADDYMDLPIDLNEYLVENNAATFYIRVTGNSMVDAGINDKDLLVVDRSKTPDNNDIVIGVLNGEFTVKRINKTNKKLYLVAANEQYKRIEITEEMDFLVWGVVTYVIHKTK